MSTHVQTEFDFINQMYVDTSNIRLKCVVCGGKLEKGENVYCRNCKSFLLSLEDDIGSIPQDLIPQLQGVDMAIAYLALSEVLPCLEQDRQWISSFALYQALEGNRHYQALSRLRTPRRLTQTITQTMKKLGWEKNRTNRSRTGTFNRAEATA